jgi:hypothetical protein
LDDGMLLEDRKGRIDRMPMFASSLHRVSRLNEIKVESVGVCWIERIQCHLHFHRSSIVGGNDEEDFLVRDESRYPTHKNVADYWP